MLFLPVLMQAIYLTSSTEDCARQLYTLCTG